MRPLLVVGVVCCALLSAGCPGKWAHHREGAPGHSKTEVTVVTDPPKADVSVNGEYLGRAPLIVPLEYPHEVRVYERRRYLPWPRIETREVPIFTVAFTFSAVATGYAVAEEKIVPQGEEKREVLLTLRPKPVPAAR